MAFDPSAPMLASEWNLLDHGRLPLISMPKLDGIRCLVIEREGRPAAVTRSLRPLPNLKARRWIEEHTPIGCDGELIVRGGEFHDTTAALMSRDGDPDFEFHLFDFVSDYSLPYRERLERRDGIPARDRLKLIHATEVACISQLDGLFEEAIATGAEGLVLRSPEGRYQPGRDREGLFMKLKESHDSEALIVGTMPEAEDLFSDRLGALIVRWKGVEFRIGTGMSHAQRRDFWSRRSSLIGKMARFRYQRSGMKSAPRFPVFSGIRHEDDL